MAHKSIRAVIRQSGVDPAQIGGIGLTGQMHGLVLLDKDGEVLRPSILWNDQRTQSQCDEIHQRIGKEKFIQITGNVALTGFTAPKILWVKENEPDVYAKAAHVLLPKDFVRYKLTGEYAMDKADGAGTVLMDLRKRDWSEEVLHPLDIPRAWMPPLFEGPRVTGKVTPAAAAATGLKAGIPAGGWRRPGGPGCRRRRGEGRDRCIDVGHQWRGIRHDRRCVHRTRRPAARVLSFRAGEMASDGGYAFSGRQPALVS